MEEENYAIPRTLDAPNLFLLWEFDVAVLFLLVSFLGALMGGIGFLFGVGLAFVVCASYMRLKEEGGKGLIKRVAYWFGPSDWASQKLLSHIRERIG